jgi:hypothetical protein
MTENAALYMFGVDIGVVRGSTCGKWRTLSTLSRTNLYYMLPAWCELLNELEESTGQPVTYVGPSNYQTELQYPYFVVQIGQPLRQFNGESLEIVEKYESVGQTKLKDTVVTELTFVSDWPYLQLNNGVSLMLRPDTLLAQERPEWRTSKHCATGAVTVSSKCAFHDGFLYQRGPTGVTRINVARFRSQIVAIGMRYVLCEDECVYTHYGEFVDDNVAMPGAIHRPPRKSAISP